MDWCLHSRATALQEEFAAQLYRYVTFWCLYDLVCWQSSWFHPEGAQTNRSEAQGGCFWWAGRGRGGEALDETISGADRRSVHSDLLSVKFVKSLFIHTQKAENTEELCCDWTCWSDDQHFTGFYHFLLFLHYEAVLGFQPPQDLFVLE